MKKIILFIFSLLLCSTLLADPIKEFVVIGDSLSDNGNLYKLFLKTLPKSPPYYRGRFSNGPTWAENLGEYFYDKNYIDYKIIAYGGATAYVHDPAHDKFVAPITLDGEMALYYADSLLKDKSKVLFAFWMGSNDYLYEEQDDMEGVVKRVVDKTIFSVEGLARLGAQNIIVLNEPDLARTPFARNHHNGDRLHAFTIMHNKKLNDDINSLRKKYPKVKFVLINIYDLFNELLDNTDKFNKKHHINITNLKDSCWLGGMKLNENKLDADLLKLSGENKINNFDKETVKNMIMSSPALSVAYAATQDDMKPCANADEYVFWDDLHPTAVVHSLIAKEVAEVWERG